jgi:hypothetical protein
MRFESNESGLRINAENVRFFTFIKILRIHRMAGGPFNICDAFKYYLFKRISKLDVCYYNNFVERLTRQVKWFHIYFTNTFLLELMRSSCCTVSVMIVKTNKKQVVFNFPPSAPPIPLPVPPL